MRIVKENWEVLTSLFPAGWQQMAWQSGAVERLRGLASPDVLLRTLMLHVARGYSLRETVVRAKLANWADISDVALLKRLRNSEEWLRLLCIELLHQAPRWVFILSSLIADWEALSTPRLMLRSSTYVFVPLLLRRSAKRVGTLKKRWANPPPEFYLELRAPIPNRPKPVSRLRTLSGRLTFRASLASLGIAKLLFPS